MTIVLAGGSGFIGTKLSSALLIKGHTVIVVATSAPTFTHENLFFIKCDLATQELPYGVLERTDAIINLTGVPITKKWTQSYKAEILSSRVRTTRNLVASLAQATIKPSVFISASLTGYYGETGDILTDEQSQKGIGFLPEVADAWESEVRKAEVFGTRVVIVRTAPILGRAGILPLVTRFSFLGVVCYVTKKDYWRSWIHEYDIIAVYVAALETSTIVGVINACSPCPVTHKEFVQTTAVVLHKKILGSLPHFLTSLFVSPLFQYSQRVMPQRLLDKGFVFTYPTLSLALQEMYTSRRIKGRF